MPMLRDGVAFSGIAISGSEKAFHVTMEAFGMLHML
jgi:hypothetical protein